MESVEEHHVKDMFEILPVVVLSRCRTLLVTLGASTWRVLLPQGLLACRPLLRPRLPAVVLVVVHSIVVLTLLLLILLIWVQPYIVVLVRRHAAEWPVRPCTER